MTQEELQERWKRIYRIVQKERFMRMEVFKGKPKQQEKVAEMDVLLGDVEAIKNALKQLIGPGPTQGALFEETGRGLEAFRV